MEIGIIGAGFTGLAAAYTLAKEGHEVTVFESEDKPGGLAIGFKEPGWKWSLEKHYHHLFASDYSIQKLAAGVGQKIIFERPVSSTYIEGKIYQLDSPLSLMGFTQLPIIDRIWTGLIILYLKLTPFWKSLEKVTAENYLKSTMGEKSWNILWRPLFLKKFGKYASKIPASWFWARVKKRSSRLGYPVGGFESLAKAIEKESKKSGVNFIYKTFVERIGKVGNDFEIVAGSQKYFFDRVICTLPSSQFAKITSGLPKGYAKSLKNLKGVGAVNLVLTLAEKFLPKGGYWLNINETDYPFLAIVEHTNLVPAKYYGGDRVLYVGNYLPVSHRYFSIKKEALIDEFLPYLKKINPFFQKSWIKQIELFKAPFAQPVIPLNYSKVMPSIKTPVDGLYLANIQQVYPWDRGTNYAVELGEKAAKYAVKKPFFIFDI